MISNMASGWLANVLPASQKQVLKIDYHAY